MTTPISAPLASTTLAPFSQCSQWLPRTTILKVLADAIKLKGGSVEAGLRFYLGGDAVTEDGGYVAKVLAERVRLDQVAAGMKVPLQ